MESHSTAVAGLKNIPGGDDRFYNNLFVNRGFVGYDRAGMPSWMEGNVFLHEAQPSPSEASPLLRADFDPGIKLIEKPDGIYLEIGLDRTWAELTSRPLVTTDMLGKAKIPDLPYLQPNRKPYRLDTDYLGKQEKCQEPFPRTLGIFRERKAGVQSLACGRRAISYTGAATFVAGSIHGTRGPP